MTKRVIWLIVWWGVGVSSVLAQAAWSPPYQSASAHFEQGRVAEAYEEVQQILARVKRTSGIDSPTYPQGLRLLTLMAAATSDYPRALAHAQQEAALYEMLPRPSPQLLGQALQNQGVLYLHLDSLPAAEHALERAAALLEAVDSSAYGELLYQLAQVHHRQDHRAAADSLYRMITAENPLLPGNPLLAKATYYRSLLWSEAPEAEATYQQRIGRLKAAGDTLTTTYADAYYRWAGAHINAGHWAEAVPLYQRAKRVYDAISLTDSTQYASVLHNLGVLALAQDDPRQAAKWIEEAFRIRRRYYTVEDGELWSSVDNLAMAYHENENDVDALALYDAYLSPADTTHRYPWQYAVALSNRASIYQEQEQYKTAEEYYQRATRHLKRTRLSTANQQLHRASIFYNVARNQQNLAHFDSAIYYYKEAIEIIRRVRGTRSDEYVAAINGIASLYHDIGHFVEADIFYQEALKGQEELTGRQHNTYASILNNYALVCQAQGNFRKANQLLDKSLKIKEELLGTGHPEYVLALTNVGIAHLEAANYEQARPLLEMALSATIERWGKEHPAVVAHYINLSRLEMALGNYPEAEPRLQQAAAVAEMYYGREHPEFAQTQIELANLYLTLGNYGVAERLLSRSKVTLKERYGQYHPEHATVTQNLAALYEVLNRIDTAEALYREALDIDLRTLGKQHPSYAVTLNNLAALYQNRGDHAAALPLLEESQAISKNLFGEEHPRYTTTLLNLGLLYQDLGKYQQAQEYIERAVALRKRTLGTNHPDYAYSLYSQAVLYHKLGAFDRAEPVFREAARQYIRQIRTYFPSLSEKEKSAFYQRIEPVLHALRDFVIDRVVNQTQTDTETKQELLADFYDLQLVTKAILLNASNKIRTAILSSEDAGLIERYQQWTSSKETLARLYTLTKEEWQQQPGRIDSLEERANELEKELSRRSTAFANDLESKNVTWRDVQGRLQPEEVAVEMIRVEKDDSLVFYVALGITPTAEAPTIVVLPEGKRMENRNFLYYQNAIDFSIADELSYDLYWKPLQSLFPPGTETVYLAPDGVYNKISLNSLLNVRTRRFLIEESNVRRVSSTRELTQERPITEDREAYLLGYPTYRLNESPEATPGSPYDEDTFLENTLSASLTPSSRLPFADGLHTLPGTEQEVAYLDQLLRQHQWTTHTYLEDDAREEVLKQVASPRLVHVATHGYFMSDLLPEAGTGVYGVHLQNITANPLLRSGLLLAGAEQTIRQQQQRQPVNWQREDGILTAYEAMNLKLGGTELVVLSACETGLGEIRNGEGVYGLQRAFLIAGANSVLMSLWNVNDRATTELMQLFYRKWLEGEDKFTALRTAQLAMMKKHRDPYYWGGFVMVGR